MAEITEDHVSIFYYDLNEDAQKAVAEAEGLSIEEYKEETNWEIFPIGTIPTTKTE